MAENVKWLSYDFQVFPPGTTWNAVAGIYIFTSVNVTNQWVALYVGQTHSFAERLPNHERWPEAQRQGATAIHACVVREQGNRDLVENQLIQAYQPRLNEQLRY